MENKKEHEKVVKSVKENEAQIRGLNKTQNIPLVKEFGLYEPKY